MPHSDPIPDDLPDRYRAVVLAYDGELDQIHPGWRRKQPFGELEYDDLARVKWLLKRRELLLHRRLTGPGQSVPAPRDWTVKILPTPADPRQCFALPIDPQASVHTRRDVTDEPPARVAR